MAFFHLSVKNLGKQDRCSGAAKIDYITRSGAYSERGGLVYKAEGNLPGWASSGREYFAAGDKFSRANGRILTEIECALPSELSLDACIELTNEFVADVTNTPDGRLPFVVVIHGNDDDPNRHLHLAYSEHALDGLDRSEETWFKRANSKDPASGGAKRTRVTQDIHFFDAVRERWAEYVNEALEKSGINARVDYRSFRDRGLDSDLATIHIGPAAYWREKRGKESDRAEYNRRVRELRIERGFVDPLNPNTQQATVADSVIGEQVPVELVQPVVPAIGQGPAPKQAQAAYDPTAPGGDYYKRKAEAKEADQDKVDVQVVQEVAGLERQQPDHGIERDQGKSKAQEKTEPRTEQERRAARQAEIRKEAEKKARASREARERDEGQTR